MTLHFDKNLPRVRAALEIVREADPVRWKRLHQYMPVLIEGGWGNSSFNPRLGAAFLVLHSEKDWRLAGIIIHELTHAYLFARWRVPYKAELKKRHEMICLREEIRFYRHFLRAFDCDEAEGKVFIEKMQARHRAALETRWWERSRWEHFAAFWRDGRKRGWGPL
ncbi:MAG: hypothetical protein ACXWK5_10455 [Myxococcaceae bacterium]